MLHLHQRNDGDGSIEASGRYGQKICINPAKGLTVVKFSASPDGAACATSAARVRKRDDPARALESAEAMVAAALAVHRAVSRRPTPGEVHAALTLRSLVASSPNGPCALIS
ncbi:hypothetical protein [Cupriavidus basilensis]|uniref:hypothetical protein n=1 Tax=Cupriavidus basilensis TaxID=68895 RepID=UPI0039F6CD70